MIEKVDFRSGYEKAMVNAESHLKAAELLAEKVSYGIANSHLILSAEEGVKAYMCYAKFYEPEIQIKDFDGYFKDHKLKHKTIRDMFFFINLIKEVLKVFSIPFKNIPKTKKDISMKELIKKKDEGYENIISWLNTKPELNYNEQWWNDANTNKNVGFYVNLLNNKWQSPADVSKDEYEKSHEIVNEVLAFMRLIPEIQTNKGAQKIYAQVKALQEDVSQ